jgi:hypothetical protein
MMFMYGNVSKLTLRLTAEKPTLPFSFSCRRERKGVFVIQIRFDIKVHLLLIKVTVIHYMSNKRVLQIRLHFEKMMAVREVSLHDYNTLLFHLILSR